MADGAGLRLTTARYFTPNGTSIQATGITPDVLVPKIAGTEEPSPEGHMEFREKDLRHHLENGGNLESPEEKTSPPTIDESNLISDKVIIDEKTKEKLKNDNQLNTALLVLKSLNVLTGQKSDK
jgi:carboxyl-terminal processing protease